MVKEKVFNPDNKKEVKGGLVNTGLTLGGVIFGIGGFIIAFTSKIAGDILWLIGAGLIVTSIIKSFHQKHGKGFKTANIAMKILLLVFLTIFIIIANSYVPGA